MDKVIHFDDLSNNFDNFRVEKKKRYDDDD